MSIIRSIVAYKIVVFMALKFILQKYKYEQ